MGLGSRHGLQQTCALCRGRLTTKEPVQLCSCRHPANHKPGPVVRRQLLGSRITRPLCGGLLLRRLCASSSAKLGGHACWSCGLTECEFLVLSQVVHVDVAIGLHPVFVGFDGERADEA